MGRFDDMNKRHEQHTLESGRFLKFDDGDKHLLVFLGFPHIREVYWDGTNYHDWKDGCGKEKSLKTSMNVAIIELVGGRYIFKALKVLENSKTFFKQVNKMDVKYGVDNEIFEVERTGQKAKDTTYTILPEAPISPELRAQLDALELNDLTKDRDDDDQKGGSGGSTTKQPDPPAIITQDEGNAIIERLKALKAALGDAQGAQMMADFLAKFGIKQIRQLPAARLKEAQQWIAGEEENLRHAKNDGGVGAAEADPFS
ncbi:MAG: hypothetical protein WC326_12870 [Candidatus Delongbacteria bacterium]